MRNLKLRGTITEICLIVAVSATAGLAWNWTLLTGAWRGSPAPSAQTAAVQGEDLPMPIGLAQVKEMLDAKQAVVVDARNAQFFARGHIAGAVTLPLEEARKTPTSPFKTRVATDATIIAYCNGFSCHDSMDLAKLLMHAGYGSVYVFEGGFPEWRDAGYPTATGAL